MRYNESRTLTLHLQGRGRFFPGKINRVREAAGEKVYDVYFDDGDKSLRLSAASVRAVETRVPSSESALARQLQVFREQNEKLKVCY